MTAQKTGNGKYTAAVPGTLSCYTAATALTTAVGANSDYSNLVSWLPIKIACYKQGETLDNAIFNVTFQSAH